MSNESKPLKPRVAILMGSRSDLDTMNHASDILVKLDIPYEVRILSAHRAPDALADYVGKAEERGIQVIIAGAGGAAHLAGVIAAKTALPVLGVPMQSKALQGLDSLLSIVQMPKGIPVGTLAIGQAGAANAGLLAGAILALTLIRGSRNVSRKFREEQTQKVLDDQP